MKIALYNWSMARVGGSELYTKTLADHFRELGHSVTIHTPHPGKISEGHEISTDRNIDADIVILNQPSLNKIFTQSKIIQVSHSPFVPAERFLRMNSAVYVSVTPEIKDLEKKYGFDSELIYNPIDLGVYNAFTPSDKPKTVFLHTRHAGVHTLRQFRDMVHQAGYTPLLNEEHNPDVSSYLMKADVVLGFGRSAIEGMITGRMTISGDKRKYTPFFQGYGEITLDNFGKALYSNFTGRPEPKEITTHFLQNTIDRYDRNKIEVLRDYTREIFSVERIARKLLTI